MFISLSFPSLPYFLPFFLPRILIYTQSPSLLPVASPSCISSVLHSIFRPSTLLVSLASFLHFLSSLCYPHLSISTPFSIYLSSLSPNLLPHPLPPVGLALLSSPVGCGGGRGGARDSQLQSVVRHRSIHTFALSSAPGRRPALPPQHVYTSEVQRFLFPLLPCTLLPITEATV